MYLFKSILDLNLRKFLNNLFASSFANLQSLSYHFCRDTFLCDGLILSKLLTTLKNQVFKIRNNIIYIRSITSNLAHKS